MRGWEIRPKSTVSRASAAWPSSVWAIFNSPVAWSRLARQVTTSGPSEGPQSRTTPLEWGARRGACPSATQVQHALEWCQSPDTGLFIKL